SNEDEWIYVIRTGVCRVIKSLNQVRPKLRTKKKARVIYDHFGLYITLLIMFSLTFTYVKDKPRQSHYGMDAIETFNREIISPQKQGKFYIEMEQIREKSVFVSIIEHTIFINYNILFSIRV
ncbi:unnamed protein product, partial [Didymodactylos carnosus]